MKYEGITLTVVERDLTKLFISFENESWISTSNVSPDLLHGITTIELSFCCVFTLILPWF